MVHLSSKISLLATPLAGAGEPAEAVNVLSAIAVILYAATVGAASLPNVSATATSEQTVLVWLATTGSG